jgi:polyhydroxyalkanoate synthesis regulator phasin
MQNFKFITSLLILAGILSCSKITQKVEEKVDEKVNSTIEKNMKKIDSTFTKEKLDSLKKQLDSLKNENPKQKSKTGK